MRRLVLAAACSTLLLAACSDQSPSPTEPGAPEPEAVISGCTVTRFPLLQASALIAEVFPRGKLRLEALARAGAIALFWNTCHASAARKLAVNFVNWMNSNSSSLIGTQEQRNDLINLILDGVGVPSAVPEGSPGDFGIGFFDPTNTDNTLVKTQNGTALVKLEPGSFTEPTTIVISRRTDNFELTDFDGNQFPPYFDYDAINASGNHILENGKFATIGFCLLDTDVQPYPPYESIRIGHNPVQINQGVPSGLPLFEILDFVDLTAEGLADELSCGNLDPYTPIIIGGFGRGVPGLANAAWRATKHHLGPVAEALFLPEALHAATLGTLPPPGGRASSLSPFGVVEAPENTQINFDVAPDESSVAHGTVVNNLYASQGVTFQKAGTGSTCGEGPEVYASSDQPAGFGSSPNVVTLCGSNIASDISENTFGLIQANFDASAVRVCIDVAPVGEGHFARLDAFDATGALLGSSSSAAGVTETLCFADIGIRSVRFSGAGASFARFDNLLVDFEAPPPID